MAPPPPIFPNVITGPGSPPGNQPQVVNTIVQAFGKQRVDKEKITKKNDAHVDTRKRIVQFLAAPASYNDPLRTLSVDPLSELTDVDLMHQAFQLLTIDNLDGSLRLSDGSIISMRQCIDEFANNSKIREDNAIRRRLKERLSELHDIAEVERYKNMNEDDEIDHYLDDNLSCDGILDFGDEQSSSTTRKLHSTVAGATVGKKQVRHADKRPHQPTNRLGVNVAMKDRHVIYATENRTLKDNRRLLMVPGAHSKSVLNTAASVLPVFPGNVLLELEQVTSPDLVPPTSANLVSSLVPVVVDSQLTTVVEGIHQQNADVASSMSTAPFAAGQGGGADGADDYDNSSSYRQATDYGTEDNPSGSSSVHSDYDGSNASDALPADYDVNYSWSDGHHSDLFENLFRTLPADANKYRLPGTTFNGPSGPLLFPPCDHSSAVPALLSHVDDGVFLLQDLHDPTFEQRTRLLCLN
jgi:hypothetical protein